MKKILWLVLLVAVVAVGVYVFTAQRVNGPQKTSSDAGEELPAPLPSNNDDSMNNITRTFSLDSSVFQEGGTIPEQYTCDADNINPPLAISNVPEEAETLALIMDDPDIPDSVRESKGIDVFDHWVVFNIPATLTEIVSGQEPDGTLGRNSRGTNGYIGPCPPDGEHRYFFKLYALDTSLNIEEGATKTDVEEAMQGHILEEAQIMGRYSR